MHRRSLPLIALNLSIGLVVAGSTAAYGAMSQSVEVTIDGSTETVRTFGGTVGDVLDARGVELRPQDEVTPAVDAPLKDGEDITVEYARPVTLAVDGVVSQHTMTASTVEEAFDDLGVDVPVGAYLSEPLDQKLSRDENDLVVSSVKTIDVWADAKKHIVTTNLPTWSEVVEEAGVRVGDEDVIMTRDHRKKLVESSEAFVVPSKPVRVVRVETVNRTEDVEVDFPVEVQKDAEMMQGEVDVVTEGVKGKNREDVEIIYADGKVHQRKVLKRTVVEEPKTQVEKHGTSTTPPDSVWDKIAQCESGGNWSINTGNGYYGGLQFSAATWRSVGGPGLPHEHSREVQIKYAKILQARSGWGQWGCAHARFN